jgi:hypothetical protein
MNDMKIKNGIIIDGVLHEGIYETVSCSDCSMEDICIKLKGIDTMCCILNCDGFATVATVATDIDSRINQ